MKTRLSKLKQGQYFKFHRLIRSQLYQFINFYEGKYVYYKVIKTVLGESKIKQRTRIDYACYIGKTI